MFFPGNRSDLNLIGVIIIKALITIGRGKNLYVSHGSEYAFPSVTSHTERQ